MIRAWLATFVRRWHTNPSLCHTVDPIGAHSARMGVLALHFWPDASRDLLVACLCHDLGESVTGDVPFGIKQKAPDLAELLDIEEQYALADLSLPAFVAVVTDKLRLKYLDRLDAYLWAKHHAPHVLAQDDWRECLAWLQREADTLNIKDQPL
jgi:5'-deoxynucleotidase YfbR-like HD superfamily hydrolase